MYFCSIHFFSNLSISTTIIEEKRRETGYGVRSFTKMISPRYSSLNPTICNRNSNNPLIVGYIFILFLNFITT
nr:MAG TPA: hypothetical protein [Caudoviricetes sp.]